MSINEEVSYLNKYNLFYQNMFGVLSKRLTWCMFTNVQKRHIFYLADFRNDIMHTLSDFWDLILPIFLQMAH